jgi:electron transfer flavoprotein alpha subunit
VAGVWVYAELHEGAPAPSALELLAKARDLGEEVSAVALGAGASQAAGALGEHGAARVFAGDDAVFDDHLAGPRVEALHRLVQEHSPSLILFAVGLLVVGAAWLALWLVYLLFAIIYFPRVQTAQGRRSSAP